MGAFMVEQFFSLNMKQREAILQNDHQSNKTFNSFVLLSGPPSCGKTSLLFQFAFNAALIENGREVYSSSSSSSSFSNSKRNVVFICNRRSFEWKPPFLSQDVDPSSEVFRRIQIKYVHDDEDLNKYFAAFHLHDTMPAAVVIDDFGHLFDQRICQDRYANPRGRDLAMARTLALCHNAISYANKHGRHCTLLISDTHHGGSPRLLFIYKRWISTVATVHGDESGSYSLKATRDLATFVSTTVTAVYSIALQSLFLERIVEEARDH